MRPDAPATIGRRRTEGRNDRLLVLAAELVQQQVALIAILSLSILVRF